MTYIMGQMRGVGVVFSQLFGIGIPSGVLAGALIVFIYAGLGGMKGITYTQVAQYCVMAFAYTLPAIFIAMALTGNVVPQLGLIGEFTADGGAVPFLEKLNRINTEIGFQEYTSGKLSTINMFLHHSGFDVWNGRFASRYCTFLYREGCACRSKSACWTLSFIAVIYLTAPTIGAFSRVNLIEKLNGTAYAEAPDWFKDF